MSYDLAVFDVSPPFQDATSFTAWYRAQVKWEEGHGYGDPAVTTEPLRKWFMEIIRTYPPLNGPHAPAGADDPRQSDYCIARSMIYVAFPWSQADLARDVVFGLARKYRVGFIDVSSKKSNVYLPDAKGKLQRVFSMLV